MLKEPEMQPWVLVVSKTGKPLMPCSPRRARKLVLKGKAIKRWRRGLFYIKLTEREDGDVQEIALGVDPGSMREGFTVMSSKRTLLNIQAHAVNGKAIKKTVESRSSARRTRRTRNTPCRPPRWSNRKRVEGWVPPSTKARWQFKLNVLLVLSKLYPITKVAVEDVSTELKKGEKRRNRGFSPVQAGKNWLYVRIRELNYQLVPYTGRETYGERNRLGLYKTDQKLANVFAAHCVDSWVITNKALGHPHSKPDMKEVLILKPLLFTRRQLHRFNPVKGGTRPRYGGTVSEGLKKGTLIFHPKWGKTLLGGNNGKGGVTLNSHLTNKRLTQSAKLGDCRIVAYSPWTLFYAEPKQTKENRIVTSKQRLCSRLTTLGVPNSRMFFELKNPINVSSPT